MDCSINEERLSYLHLLWQEEKIIESNKEQVILHFFAPSHCCAHFKCCFKDLLLNYPRPSAGDVECFLSVLGEVEFSFCIPSWGPGSEFPSMTTASFKHLSFPVGKELPLDRYREWVGLLPAISLKPR